MFDKVLKKFYNWADKADLADYTDWVTGLTGLTGTEIRLFKKF